MHGLTGNRLKSKEIIFVRDGETLSRALPCFKRDPMAHFQRQILVASNWETARNLPKVSFLVFFRAWFYIWHRVCAYVIYPSRLVCVAQALKIALMWVLYWQSFNRRIFGMLLHPLFITSSDIFASACNNLNVQDAALLSKVAGDRIECGILIKYTFPWACLHQSSLVSNRSLNLSLHVPR